ncbi:hypothetical protein ACFV16_08320 [Streptomyces massasporeus]|uniref:hypothetical protein n=1 Tax=Streptomyces massasporeus TaxID=67324 RepID=UPI00369D1A47
MSESTAAVLALEAVGALPGGGGPGAGASSHRGRLADPGGVVSNIDWDLRPVFRARTAWPRK